MGCGSSAASVVAPAANGPVPSASSAGEGTHRTLSPQGEGTSADAPELSVVLEELKTRFNSLKEGPELLTVKKDRLMRHLNEDTAFTERVRAAGLNAEWTTCFQWEEGHEEREEVAWEEFEGIFMPTCKGVRYELKGRFSNLDVKGTGSVPRATLAEALKGDTVFMQRVRASGLSVPWDMLASTEPLITWADFEAACLCSVVA